MAAKINDLKNGKSNKKKNLASTEKRKTVQKKKKSPAALKKKETAAPRKAKPALKKKALSAPAKKKEAASPKKRKLAPKKKKLAPLVNKQTVPAKKRDPVPLRQENLVPPKKKKSADTLRPPETTSWKFFEKNGSVQIKVYTESQAVFSKLAGIQGIQKSAKYFVKGNQVGIDFIVPLDLAESVCNIAGVKIPKVNIKKPLV